MNQSQASCTCAAGQSDGLPPLFSFGDEVLTPAEVLDVANNHADIPLGTSVRGQVRRLVSTFDGVEIGLAEAGVVEHQTWFHVPDILVGRLAGVRPRAVLTGQFRWVVCPAATSGRHPRLALTSVTLDLVDPFTVA